MIIAFVQTKGGTGKSTLALNLAFSRKIQGRFSSIAMVELDAQGTLKKWWDRRLSNRRPSKNVTFTQITSTDRDIISEKLEALEAENELLLLDVPGESTGKFHTQFACAVADIVLIPMRTSTNDEEAFEDNLLPIINRILKVDKESRDVFYIIPAFTHPLANKKKILSYFREFIPPYIHCLTTPFSFGSVFENFSRGGNNLYEYASLVKGNSKLFEQAKRGLIDIERIADAIINIG